MDEKIISWDYMAYSSITAGKSIDNESSSLDDSSMEVEIHLSVSKGSRRELDASMSNGHSRNSSVQGSTPSFHNASTSSESGTKVDNPYHFMTDEDACFLEEGSEEEDEEKLLRDTNSGDTPEKASDSNCSNNPRPFAENLTAPLPSRSFLAAAKSESFKRTLLFLLVIQTSAAILTGRYTRSSVPQEDLYEISHLVLTIECVKLFSSLFLEYQTTGGKLLDSLNEHIFRRPIESVKVLVPAVLYVIQSSLVYIALSNLNAAVFISLQQGKLICTAIVSVWILQRSYSIKQWICLVTLAVGVAIIALDEKKGGEQAQSPDSDTSLTEENAPEQSFVIGLLAVTLGCFSSSFAGVYFEKVLAPEKSSKAKMMHDKSFHREETTTTKEPSLYTRNIQLASFSMTLAYVQGVCEAKSASYTGSGSFENAERKPFFHGFTPWVCLLVILQAGGGLLVSAVMKYADNVLKGLATGISVVLSSLCSMVLFKVNLSSQFILGASIIFASVFFFSNDLPKVQFLESIL